MVPKAALVLTPLAKFRLSVVFGLFGNGVIFYGTPMTIGCTAVNAPIGYWTGTPTGGIPFRCQ